MHHPLQTVCVCVDWMELDLLAARCTSIYWLHCSNSREAWREGETGARRGHFSRAQFAVGNFPLPLLRMWGLGPKSPGTSPAVLWSVFGIRGYQRCEAQQTELRNLATWTFALLSRREHFFPYLWIFFYFTFFYSTWFIFYPEAAQVFGCCDK